MKKLSDLEKHLEKFDEISIEPEATDIDKLIEQYDDIILENPKEEQKRLYKKNQKITKNFLDEQYIKMGQFFGKMVDVATTPERIKWETTEEKIIREIDRSKKPSTFKELEDNYLIKKFGVTDDMSDFSYKLGTERTFVMVMSINSEELESADLMKSSQEDELVNRKLRWCWNDKSNRLEWKFHRNSGDSNTIFKVESLPIKKGNAYITFWKMDKDIQKVQVSVNNESALSHRIDTQLYTSIKPYDISIDDFISWNLYDFRIYDIYLNHSEQLMVTEELSKLHGVDV